MLELPGVTQMALIVHDMNNELLKEGGHYPGAGRADGTAEFIAHNVALLEAARDRGMPVFFTGHNLRADARDAPLGGRSATLDVLKDGSWGAGIIEELEPQPGEWRIRKGGGFSAFTGTPLEKWLRRLGVTTIVIAGAGIGAGVAATAFAARECDLLSVVAADACDSVGSEVHAAATFVLARFAQVASTAEIVEAIRALP